MQRKNFTTEKSCMNKGMNQLLFLKMSVRLLARQTLKHSINIPSKIEKTQRYKLVVSLLFRTRFQYQKNSPLHIHILVTPKWFYVNNHQHCTTHFKVTFNTPIISKFTKMWFNGEYQILYNEILSYCVLHKVFRSS